MKTTHKTYKLRLDPTKEQQELLNKHFGCVRSVYNCGLELKKLLYNEYGISIYKNELFGQLKDTKEDSDLKYLKDINSQSLQQAIHNLDDAYRNFFKGMAKFPKFKSRKSKNSFRVPQHIQVEGDRIYLPKFKKQGIKLIKHREVEGNIKQATFTRTPTGKYFVSVLVEKDHTPKGRDTGAVVGIDLGLKDLLITSDGYKYKNHKHFKANEKKLKFYQRKLDKRNKGSREYENQRKRVSRLHERISNTREDSPHKVSRELVDNNDIICLEDLNVQRMSSKCRSKKDEEGNYIENGQSRKRGLNRNILDAGWGMFIRMLEYKASWDERQVIKVDRFFASSKICSNCGWKNEKLELKDREWECSSCGAHHDRDENAANNILHEGLKRSSCGYGTYPQENKNGLRRCQRQAVDGRSP